MKKIYVTPAMAMVAVRTANMVANSPLDVTGASPVQSDFTGTTNDVDNNLSRFSLWDDED
ncbi:MAG: hypothetical protein IJT53_03645 [Prevotella sp.]|nr:hypothetical protein [Prevotella sp.]